MKKAGRGRKPRHEEHENHERWLVSYADFITLLFAFFVVLYATSNADLEKTKEFQDSVRSSLKLGAIGSGGGSAGPAAAPSGAVVPELINPLEGFPRRNGVAEVQEYVEQQIKRELTKREIERSGLEIHRDAQGARILLPAEALFPADDTKLKKSSLETLGKIADILKKADRRVVVEGHTDNRPARATDVPSNWELASLRATSVVRYFVKYHELDPSLLSATSYADQKPVASNASEETRARNRRIEILVTGED